MNLWKLIKKSGIIENSIKQLVLKYNGNKTYAGIATMAAGAGLYLWADKDMGGTVFSLGSGMAFNGGAHKWQKKIEFDKSQL